MKKIKDPHLEREAEKYQNPIPSREFIIALLEEEGKPMTYSHLAMALDLQDEEQQEALHRRLRAMVRDGQIIKNRKEGYAPLSKMDLIRGRVIGHPDGFGFLVPDEGGTDLFLSGKEMRAVMHGDRVVARVSHIDHRRDRREGAIVDVLERAHTELVGRYIKEGGFAYVIPENKRITQDVGIAADDAGGAKNGQIVAVKIIEPPSRFRKPVGQVTQVIGDHMAPGMEIDIAMLDHNLPQTWNENVQAEISGLDPSRIPKDAISGREDIRDLPLVTIDGEDARDFDDAVFCEPHGKGFRLLVAIADVSHYVKPGTALDAEAHERGNSVYFPGRVIPMLPEILSNGLCSINPDVDRLCMVCEMFISNTGTVRDYRFFEGVMRSHARLTYTQVAQMLVDRDESVIEPYRALMPHLEDLYALFKVFRQRREKRGAIDFDTTETRIEFGEGKKIERIVPVIRNDAHKLIEECMITANVAAADFLLSKDIPALYRIHDGPSTEKLTNLRDFLGELGLTLGGGDDPEAKHYGRLLQSIAERPDKHLIQTVLLRSMSQAVYHPENIGHFGLSYDCYAHFTSPIRRYPDLLVHRAIRHLVRGKKVSKFQYSQPDMETLGEHCSMTERRADEATRDATDWLKCEYVMDKVGEEFPGIITSVTGFGLFVELNDIYVEGLVHVTSLASDYYHFDPAKHRMVGERTGKVFRLADPVKVQVVRVDLDERKIDFHLVDGGAPLGKGGRGTGKKARGAKGTDKEKAGKKRTGKKATAKKVAKTKKKAGKSKKSAKKPVTKKKSREKKRSGGKKSQKSGERRQ